MGPRISNYAPAHRDPAESHQATPRQPLRFSRLSPTISTGSPDSPRQSRLVLPTLPDNLDWFSRLSPTVSTFPPVVPDSVLSLPTVSRSSRRPRHSTVSPDAPDSLYCLIRLSTVASDSLLSHPTDPTVNFVFPDSLPFLPSLPTVPSVSPAPDSSVCLSRSRQFRLSVPFPTVPSVRPVPDSSVCPSRSRQSCLSLPFPTVSPGGSR